MAELAEAWGSELWSYSQGHVSVLNAPGLAARVSDWLVTPHAGLTGTAGRGTAVLRTSGIQPAT
jgi:hypothetical protein